MGRHRLDGRHPLAAGAPELPGPPPPFAFLRQSWLWWLVVGQVLVIVPGVVSGYTGSAVWSWASIVGYSAFMVGTVQVMVRFLAIDRLDGLTRADGHRHRLRASSGSPSHSGSSP